MYATPKRRFTYASLSLLVYLLISFAISALLLAWTRVGYRLFSYRSLVNLLYLSMLAGMGITVLIIQLCFRKKLSLRLHLPKRALSKKEIFLALLFGVGMNIAFTLLFNLLFELFSIESSSGIYLSGDPLSSLLMVFTIVIVTPIFEEYLFRGVVLMTLQRYGDWFALIVTSLLFAMMHGTFSQAVCVFCLGLAMGYVTLRSGRLLIATLFHMANNALAVLSLLNDSEVFQVTLSLLLMIAAVGALILLICLFVKRKEWMARLRGVYDYPLRLFFHNWASITLVVLLAISMLVSFIQAL